MKRIAVTFALSLAACGKAPSTPAPAAAPAAPAAPTVVTYQCHSAQKSRDLFMRFDADGSWEIGADANSLKPTGDLILFPQSGVATWSKKNGSWTETDSFDKNKAEFDWTNDPGPEGLADHAHYRCKPV